MLKLNNLTRLFLFFLCIPACAQRTSIYVPKEKYLFPIHPGQTGELAGTMAELRSSHLHGGLDIRTNNTEGIPVLATQRGYVKRVSIQSNGYGILLVLKHPGGNTSWYAHLSAYADNIERYVKDEQHSLKKNELELELSPNQFEVKQGDTIAFVGNTGYSNGPHLHFEIRSPNNELINPLLFGFCEIEDFIHPEPGQIALR